MTSTPAMAGCQAPSPAKSASTTATSGCNCRSSAVLAGCLSIATMSRYPRALRRGMRFWPTRPAAPVMAIFAGTTELDFQLPEHEPRQPANDGHDRPPEPRGIDDAGVAAHGAIDVGRDPLGRTPQRTAFDEGGGHRRIDRKSTRLNSSYIPLSRM